MNPYASFLGEQDPREVIAATSGRLKGLTGSLTKEAADASPAPGKWSIRQIVCHLADTELAFAFRWRQALAEPLHVIQPFDQELWAKSYAAYPLEQALRTFEVLRDWNLKLIDSVTAEGLSKQVTHPERGTMTLRTILETMGGHDLNHLRQIESAVAEVQ